MTQLAIRNGLALAMLAGLALVAVPVQAHVDDVQQQHVFSFGTFVADLEPEGTPYATQQQGWTLRLVLGPNAAFQGDESTQVNLLAKQARQNVTAAAHLRGSLWTLNWTLPDPGEWNFTIHVAGTGVRATGSTSVHVYPWLGYRIMAEIPSPVTGSPIDVTFRAAWLANANFSRLPGQLDVRFEKWNEWETERLGTENTTATLAPNGTWLVAHEFATPGLYRVVLGAPGNGFDFGGMPEQRFEVAAGPPTPGTPISGKAILVGALFVAGLAWLAWERRRNRPTA